MMNESQACTFARLPDCPDYEQFSCITIAHRLCITSVHYICLNCGPTFNYWKAEHIFANSGLADDQYFN